MIVSVIIPAHNCEKTIEKAIESCYMQQCKVQVVVVENNSTDDTYQVLKKMIMNYDSLEVYSTLEVGVSSARNIGLEHVSGDVVTFLDADDYFESDIFLPILGYFRQGYDMVWGMHNDVSGNQVHCNCLMSTKEISNTKAIESILCNRGIMGSVWGKFYKKQILENMAFKIELSYMEDSYFNIQLLTKYKQYKVLVTSIIVYNYVHNEVSAVNNSALLFDKENKLQYNKTIHLMLDSLELANKDVKFCIDSIFRISVENINYANNAEQYNYLYDEIRNSFIIYALRAFKYDRKLRIRILLKGLYVLLCGKLR